MSGSHGHPIDQVVFHVNTEDRFNGRLHVEEPEPHSGWHLVGVPILRVYNLAPETEFVAQSRQFELNVHLGFSG